MQKATNKLIDPATGLSIMSKEVQAERRSSFNHSRLEWFCQYVRGELPLMYKMNLPRRTTQTLLTPRQQQELGKLVQAGIVAKVYLMKHDPEITIQESIRREVDEISELLEAKGFSYEENDSQTRRKIRRIYAEGTEARNIFAEKNLGLVTNFALRKKNANGTQGVDFNELVGEGNIGLMRAIDKFNPSLGYMFSTPAATWINQAMLAYLDSQTKTIRTPTHMNRLMKSVDYARKNLMEKHQDDREITYEAISRYLREECGRDFTVEQIEKSEELRCSCISYDQSFSSEGGENGGLLCDTFSSGEDIAGEMVSKIGGMEEFDSIIANIEDDRKRAIVRDWYEQGENEESVILSNVARKHCLAKERVRQLKSEGEREIREKILGGSLMLPC